MNDHYLLNILNEIEKCHKIKCKRLAEQVIILATKLTS